MTAIETAPGRAGRAVDLRAHAIAMPVLEWAGAQPAGRVFGVTTTAVHLVFEPGVVTVTTRDVPLMPNAISVPLGPGSFDGLIRRGARAVLGGDGLTVGGVHVHWGLRPPAWDPSVRTGLWDRRAVARRGAHLLERLGVDPVVGSRTPLRRRRPFAGVRLPGVSDQSSVRLLLHGVRNREPRIAAAAAGRLAGSGDGLTPEGDDILAATAVTVEALGSPAGLRPAERRILVDSVADGGHVGQTSSLSSTLLKLASEGRTLEPVVRLLDLDDIDQWRPALDRLLMIGHSTGRAYAFAVGATAWSLAAE